MIAHHLEIDDRLHFTLTGEKCKVVGIDDCVFIPSVNSLVCYQCGESRANHYAVTLRWPSGDRIAYSTSDGIWQHFTKQY